jgi:anti-sigma factor RsiW
MQHDKNVAGLWCHEVLARLEDAVSGTLDDDEKARVTAHVAGCAQCEKFGARYAALIDTLRRQGAERGIEKDDDDARAERVLAQVFQSS